MNSSRKKQRYTNGKPNLVIIHPPGTIKDYPFNIPQYRESYLDFFKIAEKKFQVFYVRDKKLYRGQGSFARGFIFNQGKFQKYNKKIHAKVIYNKTTLHANGGKGWSIVNKFNLYKVTFNKFRSYQLFKRFMKPTYRIRSRRDFKKYLKKITTNWAVYKPNRGAEGKGIVIRPKNNIIEKMNKFNGLLQEFIDTSEGITKIHNTYHDMRILIMNGKIVQTYIRIPKKGSYLANIAQGGKMKEIKKSKIPLQAKKIVNLIDNKLKKYGSRIYAIDFGFEKNKPYLFEINPQPGLPYKEWPMYYHVWHRELVKALLSSIKS